MHEYVHAYGYVYMYLHLLNEKGGKPIVGDEGPEEVCMYACINICMYMCTYINWVEYVNRCMYVCLYVCTYTH
jgi:hypothetical protein